MCNDGSDFNERLGLKWQDNLNIMRRNQKGCELHAWAWVCFIDGSYSDFFIQRTFS
jgi:hypothetical protein